MWKFALVLAVVHGAFGLLSSTYWLLEALRCSSNLVVVLPYGNLLETPEALDQICKQQGEFYRCLEKLTKLTGSTRVLEFFSEIENERSIFNGLCSSHLPWRRRYLEYAPCINIQKTDFCKTPEFLGADGTDLSSSSARVEEKMENCIAAILSLKCGIEAGQLYHYLLKLKGDYVYQPGDMTYTDADPSSDENCDKLVKKTGYIPEQVSEELFVPHKRVGHVYEESESLDEYLSNSLENEDSDSYLHFMEFKEYSVNREHAVCEDNDSVSELTSTLDKSDEYLSEKSEIFDQFGLQRQNIIKQRETLIKKWTHILLSLIKDKMRKPHTFIPEENYETVRIFPDGRINYYSRRRDLLHLQTIKCYNFQNSFVCMNVPRSIYPWCLKTTIFTGPREGEFFPEEFDPEFGAQWYETISKEAYLFEPWVHQSIKEASDQQSYKSASGIKHAQSHYFSVDNRRLEDGIEMSKDGIEIVGDAGTQLLSKDVMSFNIKYSYAYNFTAKVRKAETRMHLFKHFTGALPSTSKTEIKDLVPENVAEALANLYGSKESFKNIKMRMDVLGNLYIFWNYHESVIDTITCGKVNECHPKGENIWKCVLQPTSPLATDGLDI